MNWTLDGDYNGDFEDGYEGCDDDYDDGDDDVDDSDGDDDDNDENKSLRTGDSKRTESNFL